MNVDDSVIKQEDISDEDLLPNENILSTSEQDPLAITQVDPTSVKEELIDETVDEELIFKREIVSNDCGMKTDNIII